MRALIVGIGAAAAVWLLAVLALVLAGRRTVARDLAALLPNLLALFRGLLRDPRTPRTTKIVTVLAILWIASPVDLIPEFVPVVGPLDDAIVAALVLRRLLRTAGADAVREHWRGSPESLRALLRIAGGRGEALQ